MQNKTAHNYDSSRKASTARETSTLCKVDSVILYVVTHCKHRVAHSATMSHESSFWLSSHSPGGVYRIWFGRRGA